MPDKCCVPSCSSNYNNTKEYVTVFTFPKNANEKELWLRKIPRKDFVPNARSVVCVKHFSEESVIKFDELPENGEIIKIPRKKPKLKSGSYPSLFPGCPSYLSDKNTKIRKSRDDKIAQQDQEVLNNFIKNDKIISFDKFSADIDLKTSQFNLNSNVLLHKTANAVYYLFINYDEAPIVERSLKISDDLSVIVFVNIECTELPCLKHILNKPGKLNCWSELENILIYIKGMTPKKTLNKQSEYKKAANHWANYCEGDNSCGDSFQTYDRKQFLLEQITLHDKAKMAKRYSSDLIALAYSFYVQSASCYKMLYQSGVLSIPSLDHLKKLSSLLRLDQSTLASDNTSYLQAKFSKLSDNEKVVNLLIDEIHVKPVALYKGKSISGLAENQHKSEATSVQSFMICSVYSHYKEIVALVPVARMTAITLYNLTLQVLQLLEISGITPLCIISDNNRVNRNMFQKLSKENICQNVIKNPCSPSKDIFLMFDTVHLIKSTRNNWMNQLDDEKTLCCPKFDNLSETIKVHFYLLRKMFNIEKECLVKFAPQLTFKSVYPNSLERQNVNLALKIFHESNVSGLEMLSRQHAVFWDWKSTASFLEIIKKWWDIMNINHTKKGIYTRNPNCVPFESIDDERFIFLNQFVKWLQAWKDLKQKPRCGCFSEETFFALIHTTKTYILLIQHLLHQGAKFVLTAKFQNDNIEGRFSRYRQMCGGTYHVSVQDILESERKLRIQSVLNLNSNKFGNIPVKVLLSSFSEKNYSCEIDVTPFQCIFESIELDEISNSEIEILTYIGGYCTYKLNLHCLSCKLHFIADKDLNVDFNDDINVPNSTNSYISLLDRGSLKLPSTKVILILSYCFIIFQKLLSEAYESMFLKSTVKQHTLAVKLISIYLIDNNIVDNKQCCELCNTLVYTNVVKVIQTFVNICLNNYTKILSNRLSSQKNDERKLKKFKNK